MLSISSYAASPRDAVKSLPRVSHTSDFRINSDDSSSNHTFKDSYYDTWDVNWQPNPITMPVGQIRLELHYIKQMSDVLQRDNSTSSDSRKDRYNFSVHLDKARYIKARFSIEEQDTLSGSYPSNSSPYFSASTIKQAYLEWNPKNLPSISSIYKETRTAGYSGTSLNNSAEIQWTQIKLNYSSKNDMASQQIAYLGELTRSYNFFPARTGTSVSKQVWDASRTMSLGGIGDLQLGAKLEENHRRQDTDNDDSIINVSQFNLGLNGNVSRFPLKYNINYTTNSQSINNENKYERVRRQIVLNFNPPVPEGKSAGLSYTTSYDEYADTNRDTGILSHKLNWNFKPNSRVNSNASYELETTTDRLQHIGTKEQETAAGTFSYSIPGNRGSFSANLSHNIERKPNSDTRSISDKMNFNNTLLLGKNAKVVFFYNQIYSSSWPSYFSTPSTTDTETSGVRYEVNTGQGMTLNAKWQQHYRLTPHIDKKTSTQNLEVVVNWKTPANWNYTLKVKSNDVSSTPGGVTGVDYKTNDEIQALITYSF